ncbi:hypothetical protein AB0J74_06775 [Asanoa sp. NPDC049573]|uniref:hypothetical protein n=1 Tax=Asanoa sp. NPDC049573 TaxID=3155396 RepID=UPI00343E16BB
MTTGAAGTARIWVDTTGQRGLVAVTGAAGTARIWVDTTGQRGLVAVTGAAGTARTWVDTTANRGRVVASARRSGRFGNAAAPRVAGSACGHASVPVVAAGAARRVAAVGERVADRGVLRWRELVAREERRLGAGWQRPPGFDRVRPAAVGRVSAFGRLAGGRGLGMRRATEEVEEGRVDVGVRRRPGSAPGRHRAAALVGRPRPHWARGLEDRDRAVPGRGHQLVIRAILIKIRRRVVT